MNGDAKQVDVKFTYTNYTEIREEHKVCMDIEVDGPKGKTAVAISFATLDGEKEIGVEAVTLFLKGGEVKTLGAWYPGVTLKAFNKPTFEPMSNEYVNENIWTLKKDSYKGKKMTGTLCRKYDIKSDSRNWKYRVARQTVVSV